MRRFRLVVSRQGIEIDELLVAPRRKRSGPVEHIGDAIEIGVQHIEQNGTRARHRVAVGQAAFHQVRQLAKPHRACHARAAFESVECAFEGLHRGRVGGLLAPRPELLACLREEFGGFLEKDRKDLPVDVIADVVQRFVALRRRRALCTSVR
jgi:hypothetical protein